MAPTSAVKLLLSTCSAMLGLLAAVPANADPVTFAQVKEHAVNGSGDINLDWVVADGVGQLVTHSAFDLVDFTFESYTGMLPAALMGVQSAKLTIAATTTAHAFLSSGYDFQPFDHSLTLTFTRATPVILFGKSLSNLLTVTIMPDLADETSLSGRKGAHSMVLSADSGTEVVTYTSDFIDFSHTIERDLALSFSSVNPGLSIASGFLSPFRTDFTGTFDSDPAPVVFEIPEPGSLLILAAGFGGIAMALRRRRSAQPT